MAALSGPSARYPIACLGITLTLVFMLVLAGCAQSRKTGFSTNQPSAQAPTKQVNRPLLVDKARDAVVVYYALPEGYLIPITVPINPTIQPAEVAVEKLLSDPPGILLSPVPEETKLRRLFLEEDIAVVDLTANYTLLPDKEAAEKAVKALVLTLTEFPGVNAVRIMVDGESPTLKGGVELKRFFLRPSSINPVEGTNRQERWLEIYFGDATGTFLVPVGHGIAGDMSVEQLARRSLDILIKGPGNLKGLIPTTWPGTGVRSVTLEGTTLTLDLNQKALGYGGGAAFESLFLQSILFTLTSIPGINEVQILVEGEKRDYLPEGSDISRPLTRPRRLNWIGTR